MRLYIIEFAVEFLDHYRYPLS